MIVYNLLQFTFKIAAKMKHTAHKIKCLIIFFVLTAQNDARPREFDFNSNLINYYNINNNRRGNSFIQVDFIALAYLDRILFHSYVSRKKLCN